MLNLGDEGQTNGVNGVPQSPDMMDGNETAYGGNQTTYDPGYTTPFGGGATSAWGGQAGGSATPFGATPYGRSGNW